MNSENLRLFICYCIYNYTARDEHGSIRTVLTDVTFVYEKKLRYHKQIRLTLSTKEPKSYQNVDTKPTINQEIIYLMKPHLTQIS